MIMMSQNRQDTKDRLRGELDFDVNRRSEGGRSRACPEDFILLDEKMGDVIDMLREKRPQDGSKPLAG